MDVKSAFLYEKIEEEVYVCQPPGFEDPDFPDRVYKRMKSMYKGDILAVQGMSSIGELTFFLGLQVQQKKDGIFISQDKYVGEILKKFIRIRLQAHQWKTQKPLFKDIIGEEVDLTLMGYEKVSQKLTLYKAFFSQQWKFFIHTILQCLSAKTTAWNEFSSTMAYAIICLATNQKFNFSKYIFESMVKNLDNAGKFLMYPSGPTTNVADEAVNEEMDDSLVRAATTASSLEAEQDSGNIDKTQSKVGSSRRVESSGDEEDLGEDASKQERRIHDIDADEDITLVNDDNEMFDVGTLTGDEVLAEQVVAAKDVNLSVDEVTLAQALAALKSVKVQEKRDVIKESSVPVSAVSASTKDSAATTTTTTISTPRKGIVFQEPGTTTTISSQQPSHANV
ncbi:putative ribonuclease H-like domain-containing protein [Tanacetum coccineum]